VSELLEERVPEGEGSDGEGPVHPGPVLGPGERGEQVGVCRSEVPGGSVLVQEVSEVGGG